MNDQQPIDPERLYALRGIPKPDQIKAFAGIWAYAPGKDELAKLLGLAKLMGARAAGHAARDLRSRKGPDESYDNEYKELMGDLVSCFKRVGGKLQRAGLDRKLQSAWAEEFDRACRAHLK